MSKFLLHPASMQRPPPRSLTGPGETPTLALNGVYSPPPIVHTAHTIECNAGTAGRGPHPKDPRWATARTHATLF